MWHFIYSAQNLIYLTTLYVPKSLFGFGHTFNIDYLTPILDHNTLWTYNSAILKAPAHTRV